MGSLTWLNVDVQEDTEGSDYILRDSANSVSCWLYDLVPNSSYFRLNFFSYILIKKYLWPWLNILVLLKYVKFLGLGLSNPSDSVSEELAVKQVLKIQAEVMNQGIVLLHG